MLEFSVIPWGNICDLVFHTYIFSNLPRVHVCRSMEVHKELAAINMQINMFMIAAGLTLSVHH